MSANRCDRCGNMHRYCPCDQPAPEPPDPNPWLPADDRAMLDSMIGRTIVRIDPHVSGSGYGKRPDDEWLGGITVTFDTGSPITLTGWGHDWWGLHLDDETGGASQ